jgi:predicted Zn-dependent peptidase
MKQQFSPGATRRATGTDQHFDALPGAGYWWQRILSLVFVAIAFWINGPALPALAQMGDSTSPDRSIQPYIDRVMDRVTEFTLDNGMRFIVLERHQAPVVSFMTYVDVGSAQEEIGKTGAAHFLEHLAFKGTPQIGTTDYEAEQPLLEKMDRLFEQIKAAEAAGQAEEVARLQAEFEQVRGAASRYVNQNEYGQIVEQAGGVGLNATTSADATRYFYSFPSNKLELWMSLESERFLEPVFREFFEEKDVILEERRLRTDNSPIGQMFETFLETALPGHPYGRPIIGYEEDLRGMTRQDIQDFFSRYYTPSHMIAAVVGDVDPARVRQLAEVYFGRYQPRSPVAEQTTSIPPLPETPQEFTLALPAQPWYLEGYRRPSIDHPDRAVYDIISGILTGGRTSRLYQSLVVDQQVALDVRVANGFPGDRYTTLFLAYALTAANHTVDEVAAALEAELARLRTEPVSAAELERIKTQSRASLLQTLDSNQGMASLLAQYEATTGNWRNLFDQLKELEAVTAADVQRVAQALFRPENRTIGRLVPAE